VLRFVIGYVATLVAFCILDFAWLDWIANDLYQFRIGALLLWQPNWIAAMLFRNARRALPSGNPLTVPVPARPELRATRRRQ
jgi:hypothetical protein